MFVSDAMQDSDSVLSGWQMVSGYYSAVEIRDQTFSDRDVDVDDLNSDWYDRAFSGCSAMAVRIDALACRFHSVVNRKDGD